MTFQRMFPSLEYRPGYFALAVAIIARAVNDLRNPCRRQAALDWFETGRCCWLVEGLGISYDYMLIRVDDVMAMPILENRRWGKRKPRCRERWKREKDTISA
jgi:hypothetical protein